MTTSNLVVLPFLISLIISLTITPITIWVFTRLGLVIDPKKTPHPAHVHKFPVPKGGGIPVFLSVAISALLLLRLDGHLTAIIMAATLTVIVGLIDDIRGLNPFLRLGLNFLAALIVVGAGIGIAYITNPFGGIIDLSHPRISFFWLGQTREIWLWSDLFAIIWIPFLMNAINWSSGVDGQASGMIAIGAFVIGALSLTYSADITQWPVAILAFSLAGAFAGLAVFHFYPQKIMPGYSATTVAGLLLAVLSILSTTKVGTAIVVLGLPLIDATYTIIRRVANGKSPFRGDRGHLHHKLLDIGWGKRRIAIFYWLITAALGLLALNLNAKMKLFAIVGLVITFGGLFIWIYFGSFLRQPDHDSG